MYTIGIVYIFDKFNLYHSLLRTHIRKHEKLTPVALKTHKCITPFRSAHTNTAFGSHAMHTVSFPLKASKIILHSTTTLSRICYLLKLETVVAYKGMTGMISTMQQRNAPNRITRHQCFHLRYITLCEYCVLKITAKIVT